MYNNAWAVQHAATAMARPVPAVELAVHFPAHCAAALEAVKRLLEHERSPHLAADVRHEYQDKYLLAEFVTNAALVALLDALECVGLTKAHLIEAAKWARSRSVTLRFKEELHCKVRIIHPVHCTGPTVLCRVVSEEADVR